MIELRYKLITNETKTQRNESLFVNYDFVSYWNIHYITFYVDVMFKFDQCY